MKLFDAHNHIQNCRSSAEGDAALRGASEAGVEGMLVCGTCPADWGAVLELAGRDKRVVPCFGLHPWFGPEDGWLDRLEEFLTRTPSCVGEIGLDGARPSPGQEENFLAQLALARKLDRPVVIHCVKNWGRMLELLKENRPAVFMLHAYGGPAELVKDLAALNGYFSFGGEITDPARERLRAALAAVPPERLLFETDSPEPDAASWRSGPAGVAEVAAAAASVLGRPAEELAEASYANALAFLDRLWPAG